MVGRSKPQKNMDHAAAEDFASTEIIFLKAKNNDLAKALSETKVALKQAMDERDFYQRELFSSNLRNSELENYIKQIDQAARKSINAIVVSSNYITEIAQITMTSIGKVESNSSILASGNNQVLMQSPNSSKTHAVKPMIDGHVIYRPTISLRRVNEIPLDEMQRIQASAEVMHHNNSINNPLLGRDENTENSPFHHLPGSISRRRSFNDHGNHSSTDVLRNEIEEQYMDRSSNSSETIDNRLHTIEELSERMEDTFQRREDDLSIIANASSSSISIPGHGPLLSGVFRDVRVYLSPMQNVSQYLESLQGVQGVQGVTTERGKLYKTQNTPKKHYSPRTVSLDDNNQCVVTMKASESCLDQNNSNLPSVNNSFEDPTTSILTSTRIGNNFDGSCRRSVNSNYAMKSPCSNNFENTTVNENIHILNDSCDSGFNKSSKWNGMKQSPLNGQNYPNASIYTPSGLSTTCDPLEGPSTLLDSGNNSTSKEKLETLSMLGLKPTSSIQSSPNNTLSSPASRVLKRRENQLDGSPTKKNKSIYVTKRKLDCKKTLTTKAITKRRLSSPLKSSQVKKRNLMKSIKRDSNSPIKRKTLSNSVKKKTIQKVKKKISPVGTPDKKIKPVKRKPKLAKELSISPNSSVSTNSSTITSTSKKYKKKIKLEKSGESNTFKQSTSPQKSPRKRRPASKILCMKEPSLHKKMRRS